MPRPRLVYITTHPVTAAFLLRGQLAHMAEQGFDVHVISSPGPDLDLVAEREGVTCHAVPMAREIDALGDAVALTRLTRLLRTLRPDIVNASTPKAGMLGTLAAKAAGVPIRVYLLRGLRLETTTGSLRSILQQSERLTSAAATDVVAVSRSLLDAYVPEHANPRRATVLLHGSSNGVRADRFAPSDDHTARAAELRERFGCRGVFTVGFAGRLVEDKGITELLDAVDQLRAHTEVDVLLVGDDLAGDSVSTELRDRIAAHPHTHVLPRMNELGPFYAAIDVLAFPSRREGFPNVPLEAAMASRPVAGFASTGVVDAVVAGETGLLVATGDVPGLAAALQTYAEDPSLRERHGAAGHARAVRDFAPQAIWAAWVSFYTERLRLAGRPLPRPRPLVLHILPYDLARGAQVYARALVDALEDEDMVHETATLFAGEPGILNPTHLLDTPRQPYRRYGFDPRASVRLGALLAKRRPDILVTHGAEPLKYALPVAEGIPILHYRIGISAVRSGPRLTLLAAQHRAADLIAGVSNETLDEAVELFGVPRERCELIVNGRDPSRYTPMDKAPGPLLVFLGAFAPTKRPERFVDVVEALQQQGVDFRAQMIGDGDGFDALAPRARELGIEMLGRREDVPDLLPKATVFLFTSVPEGEGMPGVFIEAGFCGVATVATAVPGASTVIDDGVTGYVVPPDDFEAMVARTRELLDNPARAAEMGAAARERCLDGFTLEQSFDRWRTLLRRTLAR